MSNCFEITILAEICKKCFIFIEKIAKVAQRLWASPPVSLASGAGDFFPNPHPLAAGLRSQTHNGLRRLGLRPQNPARASHREILATPLFRSSLYSILLVFRK